MSNSNLVTYRRGSNKYSSRGGRKITKIVIHHMSGKMTGRSCVDYFCTTRRQVSSTYCIGYAGDIAQNIDEAYRPWTTGNYWVDSQAVTIEVSNITRGPDWRVSDASMNALINLVTDICRRNGIKNCTYTGTKAGVLQMHKWYQSTDCPGPYLASKFSYIANEVNKRLGGKVSIPATPTPAPKTSSSSKNYTPGTYRVNVSALNYRSGAGTSYSKNGTIRDRGTYTITDIHQNWGRLKSGKGWICLDYCTKVSGEAKPTPAKKSIDTVAREVLNGKWGNGAARSQKLEAAGYNYREVQNRVNQLIGAPAKPALKSIDTVAREVLAGKWGNGKTRKQRLESAGYNYRQVQNRVNQLL